MSITQPECAFVVLGVQNAVRLRHNIICGQRGYKIFINIISQKARLKKNFIEYKMCVLSLSTKFV